MWRRVNTDEAPRLLLRTECTRSCYYPGNWKAVKKKLLKFKWIGNNGSTTQGTRMRWDEMRWEGRGGEGRRGEIVPIVQLTEKSSCYALHKYLHLDYNRQGKCNSMEQQVDWACEEISKYQDTAEKYCRDVVPSTNFSPFSSIYMLHKHETLVRFALR